MRARGLGGVAAWTTQAVAGRAPTQNLSPHVEQGRGQERELQDGLPQTKQAGGRCGRACRGPTEAAWAVASGSRAGAGAGGGGAAATKAEGGWGEGRTKPQGERGDELWHGPGELAADVGFAKFAEGLRAAGGNVVREFADEHAVEGEGVARIEGGEAAVGSERWRFVRRDAPRLATCRSRKGGRRGKLPRRPRATKM